MVRQIVEVSLDDFDTRRDEIAQQLFSAAKDVGFFYISGHGIAQEEIDAAFAAGRAFFGLPKAAKERYPFNPETYLGWRGPDELETVTGPHFQETALSFQAKVHDIAVKILKSLFRGLGRDESVIDDAFELEHPDHASFLAWNHYPGLSEAEIGALRTDSDKLPPRLHAHADVDVLTLLFQRVGDVGLEIAPGNEVEDLSLVEEVGNPWTGVPVAREWTPLDPRPGCLTVNIGDGLTRWTDGIFKSTYHRVRAPKAGDPTGPRYSIPYFVIPKLNYAIQGPSQRWGPVTGFDLLAKTGHAYVSLKNNPDKTWQRAAYTDEIAELTTEHIVAGGNTA
ncbi:hypothetical protein N2152v2_009468 [Parachlorella kessleri]